MRRSLVALLTLGLLLGCQDHDLPTDADRPGVSSAISDGTGTTGDVGDDPDLATINEHFFWLEPMVEEPDHSLFGTFDPGMFPTVRIVCWESTQLPAEDCHPDGGPPVVVAEFTVGDGLIVETDHYKVDFDTEGLQASTSDTDFTTYRIEALTPPMTLFGGPFVFGLADFQLGENGKEARSLDTSETIGLVDGRTLPIRFRLDEGALEDELAVNSEPTDDPTGEAAFCQINCSVTVIDVDQDTEASLFDPETGDELSAILIPANTAWTTRTEKDEGAVVHVIDELVDDGDSETGELCLPSGEIPTEACYRHELSPDNPDGDDFQENTDGELPRAGVCPTSEDQALVSGGAILPSWRFLKADLVDGEVEITRPPERDVSDFLQCDVSTTMTLWDGPGGQLAGSALQWLVAPLEASDAFGGQLRDLSDLFLGEDVEMSRLDFSTSAVEGDMVELTVELLAVHPDPDEPAADRSVTFTPTEGTGALAAGAEFEDQDADPGTVTLLTDGDGRATVDLEVAEGTNRVEVTSPDARPAADEPDPVAFEITGDLETGAILAVVLSDGDPIGGATVTATSVDLSSSVSALTDDNGEALLGFLAPGDYDVTTDAPGVLPTSIRATVLSGDTTPVEFGTSRIAFQRDRGGNFDVFLMNPDGTGATALTSDAAFDGVPDWSPDRTEIAFTSQRSGTADIHLMNSDGSGVVNLLDTPFGETGPTWSPDGTRLAFHSDSAGNFEIHVMNDDGSLSVAVTDDPAIDADAAWSPDGTRIAFRSLRDGNPEIYVMNPDGSGLTRLTNNAAFDGRPAWSPDGTQIAFRSNRDGNAEIYVMNADGTGQTRLTNDPAFDDQPTWSLGGARIAFVSQRDADGDDEIFVMSANGTSVSQLTSNTDRDLWPDWR